MQENQTLQEIAEEEKTYPVKLTPRYEGTTVVSPKRYDVYKGDHKRHKEKIAYDKKKKENRKKNKLARKARKLNR